jgi:hypothetical protein
MAIVNVGSGGTESRWGGILLNPINNAVDGGSRSMFRGNVINFQLTEYCYRGFASEASPLVRSFGWSSRSRLYRDTPTERSLHGPRSQGLLSGLWKGHHMILLEVLSFSKHDQLPIHLINVPRGRAVVF